MYIFPWDFEGKIIDVLAMVLMIVIEDREDDYAGT